MLLRILLAGLFCCVLHSNSQAQGKDKLDELKERLENLIAQKNWTEAEAVIERFYRDYPASPSELQIVEKYEVDRINPIVVRAIREETNLYNRIKNSQNLSLAQRYLSTYPYGKFRLEIVGLLSEFREASAWSDAQSENTTAAYYEYLDVYPSGKHAEKARKQIRDWDDAAYKKSINDKTVTAFNYYLSNYPRGRYRSEVRTKLAELQEYEVYLYAKNNNYINNYEEYIRKYPNGKYADEVKLIIENGYYKFGNEAYESKDFNEALKHYQTYLNKFPSGRYASEVKQRMAKCRRRSNRSGAEFIMYTYDFESPIGLSFGNVKTSNVGYYFNVKMNSDIFTGFQVLYEIDDQGNHDRPGDVQRTGESRAGNVSVSFGLNYLVVYPLWIYAGAGAGYYPIYEKVDAYYSTGTYWEEDWLKNTDQTEYNLFPEAGLLLKVGDALMLKGGAMYSGEFIPQFGLGFQW